MLGPRIDTDESCKFIRKHFERIVQDSTPGRFEGESAATAYFYDLMMNGEGWVSDEDGISSQEGDILFIIEREDVRIFPELKGKKTFAIHIDNNGFIYGRTE